MKKIERILDRVVSAVSLVGYIGFIAIMLITVIDVFYRFALNNPIMGSYEIIERTVFCAVFASFAYAQRQKAHIHITMIIILFPRWLKFICAASTGFLSSATALFMAYAAFMQGQTALRSNYVTGVLTIPLYPFYWIASVMMFAFALTLLFDAIKSLTALFDDEVAKEVQSAWN